MKQVFGWVLLSVLGLSAMMASAQCSEFKVRAEGSNKEAFIPEAYVYIDSAKSDFNQDGLVDLALVFALKNNQTAEESWKSDCQRGLLVLERTQQGYKTSGFTLEGVLCSGCGGVFGDPYAGMEFNKNVLKVKHFGGSNWKWTQDYTFRFQNNRWELIGLTHDNFFGAKQCNTEFGMAGRTLNDVNFSTGKQHVVRTKDMNCIPYKDQWLKFVKSKPITLNQFRVLNDYVPLKVK
ncbi:MAG: hypothetical protein FGM54_10415 [Chitinophagaceae bacterium]|nr:hypothetical protein [Chitinophagaceae bacterium]